MDRLRREIEPVSGADFMRFLFAWQHVSADSRLCGEAALPAVLERLACFEAPAPAWEADLLPARLSDFDPDWLDRFCLSGQGVWRRRMPSAPGEGAAATLRMAPVTLLRRQHLAAWEAITTIPEPAPPLSPAAEAVRTALCASGALFFDDVLARLRLLPSQLETALSELAGQGLAACDGFAGLRALCTRAGTGRHRTREGRAARMAAAGRWYLTGVSPASAALPGAETGTGGGVEIEGGAEFAARVLLDRYGVVFRRLCTREPWLPPWRELVAVYRRREARGELRGGRFLALATGEQFALPEAVGLLREVRRRAAISGAGVVVRCRSAQPGRHRHPRGDRAPGIGSCPLSRWRPHRVAIRARGAHERGPRPERRLGSPQGAAAARRRGDSALGGRRRDDHHAVGRPALQLVGAFPSRSCWLPHLDSHRGARVQPPDTTPKTHP